MATKKKGTNQIAGKKQAGKKQAPKKASAQKPTAKKAAAKQPAKHATAKNATKKNATKKKAAKKKAAKKKAAKASSSSSSSPRRALRAPRIKALPMTWRFETGTQAVGLWVDEQVWISNSAGDVFALSREGEVMRQLKLPGRSVAAIADEAWKYAGCSDGKVYDLTGRVPRAMYDVGEANAIEASLETLTETERWALIEARIRHKELSVFLHEWGHTLGALHAPKGACFMGLSYDPLMRR